MLLLTDVVTLTNTPSAAVPVTVVVNPVRLKAKYLLAVRSDSVPCTVVIVAIGVLPGANAAAEYVQPVELCLSREISKPVSVAYA